MRGKTIQKVLTIIAATLCLAIFAGCSGGGTNTSATEEGSQQQATRQSGISDASGITSAQNAQSVDVKASVEDYTWAELSAISAEIAAAGDETAAVEVAKQYNLVGSNGRLDGTQRKLVGMGGSLVPAQIIGFAHDDKTDGGKAGITFQFVDCVAECEMNPRSTDEVAYNAFAEKMSQELSQVVSDHPEGVETSLGGWEASSMREWLNSFLVERLPEDLTSVIVTVDKSTNNTGWTKGESEGVVTTTSDKLWLPSLVELGGVYTEAQMAWASDDYRYVPEVANAEGRQYKLLRDMNISIETETPFLIKYYNGSPCSYWGRSPRPDSVGIFHGVTSLGDVSSSGIGYAYTSYGVAPCFCI